VKKIEWIKKLMIDVFAFLDFRKNIASIFCAILIPLELDMGLLLKKTSTDFPFISFV